MKKFALNNLSTFETQTLIEAAQNAELCLNFDLSKKILEPVWDDFNQDPQLAEYEDYYRAELLRVCGNFLLKFGKAKNLFNFIERGKDYLTTSSDIFLELGETNKAVTSQVLMGWAYCLENKYEAFEIFLDEAESNFEGSHLETSYLLIQVNRLIVYFHQDKFTPALKLIDEIKLPIELCSDDKLKTQYYTQTGLIYRKIKKYNKAFFNYQKAIKHAEALKNDRYLASILNNVAYFYKEIKEYDLALNSVDESLDIYHKYGDQGWIANSLDTKASILFDKKDYESALQIITKAIFYFAQGNNYKDRAAAIWIKIKCLFSLKKREEATELFNYLIDLCIQNIDEAEAQKYKNELVKNHKEFLNFSPVVPVVNRSITQYKFKSLPIFKNLSANNIQKLYFYYFPLADASKYFYKESLQFDLDEDILIITESCAKASGQDLLLIKNRNEISVGELILSNWTIENTNNQQIYDYFECIHLGKILGYCNFSEVDKDEIIVRKI